jgi:hypothetical protein
VVGAAERRVDGVVGLEIVDVALDARGADPARAGRSSPAVPVVRPYAERT